MTHLRNWKYFHGTGIKSSEFRGWGWAGVGGKKAREQVGMKGPTYHATESKFIL